MPAGTPADPQAVPQRDPEARIAELLMANSNEVNRRRWAMAHERLARADLRRVEDRMVQMFAVLARHDEHEIDDAGAVQAFREILEGEG